MNNNLMYYRSNKVHNNADFSYKREYLLAYEESNSDDNPENQELVKRFKRMPSDNENKQNLIEMNANLIDDCNYKSMFIRLFILT